MTVATPEDISNLLDLIAELQDEKRALLKALRGLQGAAFNFVTLADRDTNECNALKQRLTEARAVIAKVRKATVDRLNRAHE